MTTQSQTSRMEELDRLSVDTIRMLAIDAVQKANSGHPGMPMDSAPMAYVLWTRFLRHNPANPSWMNRDRFILSAGHASMLLYSLLHLTGYDLPIEQLKRFRQWGSHTPGHPEYGEAPGVEMSTGPLGQGLATAVGVAIAEAHLAARFNRPGHEIVDHHTYVLASDGDMMEGVTSEACSLAGHLKLGKLIVLYSDNHISIEGSTDLAFTEDVGTRFRAYDWHVQRAEGENLAEIESALRAARAETTRPSLVIVRTHIGVGSPRQDSEKAHGEPLGVENVRLTKERYGWPQEPAFYVPEAARANFRTAVERGAADEAAWRARFEAYAKEFPDQASVLEAASRGKLPEGWDADVPVFGTDQAQATRAASGAVLNALAARVPLLVGGSADLAPSNNTNLKGAGDFGPADRTGRNLHFGVREHAMGAILNGMALDRTLIPFGGTFLVFSDYMRPTIRLAALMGIRPIYVFTHDSIGLGEDGPTHQPVEHLASLRAIPNMTVLRPADANETAYAWRVALTRTRGPVALVLTRQKLPVFDRSISAPAELTARGAYVLRDADGGEPMALIVATGSEVEVALAAREILETEGIATRVVSMPSWELFEEQPEEYRRQVFPPEVTARVAVEAGVRLGWDRYTGPRGDVVCMTRFGASAPVEILMEQFGFTGEAVAERVRRLVSRAE